MLLFDELPEPVLGPHRALRGDVIANVRPIEARDEALCALEPQFRDDLFPSALVCRCGERDARHGRKAVRKHLELAILGPEVVSHCDTQCASSIANSASGMREMRPSVRS